MKKSTKKDLTMNEILERLVELQELKKMRVNKMNAIHLLKSMPKSHSSKLRGKILKQLDTIESVETLEKIKKNIEIYRFEKFIELICRIRNLTGKQSYTKRHFLSEVQTYYKNTLDWQ
jgi:hypothetical protein